MLQNSKEISLVKFIVKKYVEVKCSTLLKIDPPYNSSRKLEILRTDILWTHAASSFHYYVMLLSVLLVRRVFTLYLYWRWHWKITSERWLKNIVSGSSTFFNFFFKHQLQLFQLGLYDLFYICLLYPKISVIVYPL